ncbi:hypothetical protein [Peptostreptococcus sp. D1]|uniref:hypothetical protein n=1 Tax=Peptostreptococcus sp. D1 TaxID=72304 RepID=UPI0008E660AE|nr:hypothetical protein [Peptostreptococcus sp. D1]SFE76863.1 hypothetical protein SAMN02910278_01647 [Peptostreptococcus sp. D1]
MRNEIKELNNKNDNYISYNNNYEFKFANLQKKNDIVTANVEVTEEFTYDIPTAQGEKAMVRNDYEVILQKKGNTYYILSANIDTDADPIDGEFNANKELGYIKDDGTDNSRQSINSDDISNTFIESNLYKINNRMNEIKISISNKDTSEK